MVHEGAHSSLAKSIIKFSNFLTKDCYRWVHSNETDSDKGHPFICPKLEEVLTIVKEGTFWLNEMSCLHIFLCVFPTEY